MVVQRYIYVGVCISGIRSFTPHAESHEGAETENLLGTTFRIVTSGSWAVVGVDALLRPTPTREWREKSGGSVFEPEVSVKKVGRKGRFQKVGQKTDSFDSSVISGRPPVSIARVPSISPRPDHGCRVSPGDRRPFQCFPRARRETSNERGG